MRHRKSTLDKNPASKPLAASLLGIDSSVSFNATLVLATAISELYYILIF